MGEFASTRKTMEHGGKGALPSFFSKNARSIVVSITRRDNKRQGGCSRRTDMRAKSPLLCLARRIVIMKIEACFADRHDFFSATAGYEFGQTDVRFFMRVMWMRADRTINIGKTPRYREQSRLAPHTRRDRDHAVDSRGARARYHGVELVGEVGKIEVAMAVDQCRWCSGMFAHVRYRRWNMLVYHLLRRLY